ncbi:MAG: double-cubane-cluster-containing anaerobic reductase [Thermodesulfobacteriota bacterium]|nr:double-cubane-cluster-containing anaerobic reductase [Thermodesulfobacteriota bacterium]
MWHVTMDSFEEFRAGQQLKLKVAWQKGKKICGVYCAFAPRELIRASGAIPLSLCGTKQEPIPEAENVLPRNLCPLIKSSYGYSITWMCPYYNFSDFLIGETTCDGKTKMFELIARGKPIYVIDLPKRVDNSSGALAYWLAEIRKVKWFIEEQTGNTITEDGLCEAISIQNTERTFLKRLAYLCRGSHVPITGLDMNRVVNGKGFCVDQREYIKDLEVLVKELETKVNDGLSVCSNDTPRILLTGCPIGEGSEKVLMTIEECGGIVVCQEACSGIKAFDALVDEDKDPLKAIAERYLKIGCSCISPNSRRVELLDRLIKEFKVDGVVDLTWQACHTYNVESFIIRDYLDKRYRMPFLHIETDYSESDTEQIKVRVQAFLEIIQSQKQKEEKIDEL